MAKDEKKGWFGRHKICTALIVLLVLLVVLLVCAELFLGHLVKFGVTKYGSELTGCDIQVEHIQVSPLRGKVVLRNLDVGNPEGYKTEKAIHLGEVQVSFSPLSLLKKQIVVHDVLVANPEITYEMGMPSNIGKIVENLQGEPPKVEEVAEVPKEMPAEIPKETPAEAPKPEPPVEQAEAASVAVEEEEAEAPSGKSLLIEHVQITDGKIHLSATVLGGKALPVPLPTIHLHDIGKEKETSAMDAVSEVLKKVLSSVTEAVVDSATNIKDGIVDGIKKLFK